MIYVKKICLCKFTEKDFFHGVNNQYDSFGPSDRFVMKMSDFSANLLSPFFLDLTEMSLLEHIKATFAGKTFAPQHPFNLQLKIKI